MAPESPLDFREWIGRTEVVRDPLCVTQSQRAAAMFDHANDAQPAAIADSDRRAIPVTGIAVGSPLPPLWHWFHFLPQAPQAQLDADGHPARGGFLPPIPYPRRMFAGARVDFHHPLTIGEPAERHGTIGDVVLKSGRSGALAFVTVRYEIQQAGRRCISEEQDIVYREPGPAFAAPIVQPAPPPLAGTWTRTITPDARLLFRFSALTFNAHRIHYDRPYARDEEGYPGLVVHGPLTAMLLADLAASHSARPIKGFSFRGVAPLFDLAPFQLIGTRDADTVALEARAPDLTTALTASVQLG
jgi:3-methylfumaryl-CoA hydratase